MKPKNLSNIRDFAVFNWGKEKIDLTGRETPVLLGQLIIEEAHIKEDGSLKNKPTVCLVLGTPLGGVQFATEISLRMLSPLIKELKKYEEKES